MPRDKLLRRGGIRSLLPGPPTPCPSRDLWDSVKQDRTYNNKSNGRGRAPFPRTQQQQTPEGPSRTLDIGLEITGAAKQGSSRVALGPCPLGAGAPPPCLSLRPCLGSLEGRPLVRLSPTDRPPSGAKPIQRRLRMVQPLTSCTHSLQDLSRSRPAAQGPPRLHLPCLPGCPSSFASRLQVFLEGSAHGHTPQRQPGRATGMHRWRIAFCDIGRGRCGQRRGREGIMCSKARCQATGSQRLPPLPSGHQAKGQGSLVQSWSGVQAVLGRYEKGRVRPLVLPPWEPS